MADRIEKSIALNAPVARVWRALTDHREFGAWFGVQMEAPFAPGKPARGRMTNPKYQQVPFEITIAAMKPERSFAFTWHPYAIDPAMDYAAEPQTLVEFTLEPTADGTLLRVVESGFDKIPAGRRPEAFRMNDRGWAGQIDNIKRYLADAA